MDATRENTLENGAGTTDDPSIHLTIGAAFACFATAVDARGGDAQTLRERSLDSLEEALKVRAELWQARELEGDLLASLGRHGEAAEAFGKALKAAPWSTALRGKYVRATFRAALSADEALRRKARVGTDTRILQARPTRKVTRKPKSARIRRCYRVGRLPSGA